MKRATSLMLILSIFWCVAVSCATAEVVGVWLFDEGKGKTVRDASGNGHDGEIIGEVAWADGKFEKALEFDGGHVLVPHDNVMNLRQWTMTAWIKVRQRYPQPEGWDLCFVDSAVFPKVYRLIPSLQ